MKINDYNQMMAHMRRPGFQDGTIVPPPKPEQKTPFIDKLRTLKKAAPGLMPRSKVAILKMYMDEALRDGEITKEQHTEMLMPYFGELGENVTKQIERSDRENFADGTDKFLVKVGKPVKEGNVIEQEFMEVIGSKNRPETYKKTGVKKTLYKPQIIVKNKTVLTDDFGSKEDAVDAVKKYREKNPIKNAPPDVDTLDERKKKKYLERKARQADIIARGGIPEGGMFEGTKKMHKGHAGNIRGSQMITGDKLIYTPSKINQAMAGSEGKSRFTDLDYKIDATEKEIDKIKNSKMSAAKKKTELAKLDNKLVDYAGQSDGYKVVTLSDGTDYGGSFRKLQSIDPMDIFPGKTEVEIRDFIKNADPNNFDDQLKIRLFKENAPKLKAALLPGLEELVEGIKNIPDDIAKKRYFKLGLKALGPIGTFIAVDDTFEKLKEGKSVAEALEYGLIGTNVIGSTKDLMALSPEGKEARSVVKQQEMREQIANDFSGLDTDFDTPNVKSDMSRQEAERKWENEKIAISRKRAAEEKAIANARAVSIEGLKNLILGTRFQPAEIPKEFLATGGRVGYASKGKVDLSDLESLKGFESDSEEVIENKGPTARRSMGRLGPQSQKDRIKNKVISSFIYAVDNMDQENSTYVKDLFTNNLANIQIGYETETSGIKTDLFEKVGIIPINSETLYSTIVNLDLPKDIKAEMSAISSKAGDEELSASLKKNNMGITWDSDSQEIQGEYQFNSKDGKTSMRPVITKDEDSQISKELKIDQAIGDGTLNLTLNESDINNASGSSINYQNDNVTLFADKQSDDYGNTANIGGTVDIPLYLLNKEEKPYISAEINKNLDTGFESKQFSGSFPITDNLKLYGSRYEDDQGDWNNTNYGLGYYKSGKIGELGNWFVDADIDKDKDWAANVGFKIPLGAPEKRAYNYSTSDPEEIFDLYKDTDGFKYRPNVNWKESTTEKMFAEGGRIGFADGPDDPKRRKFMKIAGGIASIPFVGKYFKAAAPVAEKTVEIIRRGADGMPDFISDLVTKVITFGKKTFTGGRADEIAENYQLDDYVVTKQGNKTTVKKVDDQGEFGYKEHEMEVDYDPETGGYTYNEASVRPDAEGKLKDVEEFIEDVDLEDMRKYTYDD